MARSTIYCPLHRRIGHHRLGLGVDPRGNEIEHWMVGVARSARNDSAQGAQGVSPRLVSECRGPARPHGQALPGQPDQTVCGALRKMSSKCPALMAEIKDLVPWLHENKICLDVVYIRSEVNLADVPSRGLDISLQLPTQQDLLHLVESTLGSPVCTDPFAFCQSVVAPKFATPLHCRHSAAFNGLILDGSPPVTLWVNPRR